MGKRYIYSVELLGVDGSLGQEVIGEVITGAKLFLPSIQANGAVERSAAETATQETPTEEIPTQEVAQVKIFLPALGR